MWQITFLPEAKKELFKLDKQIQKIVLAGIRKVSKNPLPQSEGGYGKPLGSKQSTNLTGFFKIKFKDVGIRVIYALVPSQKIMNIVAVLPREDDYCYKVAEKRKKKYGKDVFKKSFENL
ncbi:type II toxin-antitoxin system RelE family toxin [Caldicellulosiruptor morganii]|uniref:Type II toxin-antitoxin system RelE/ParE family toxin n=1 Tax=Caldicellulosiruptor morganii TaxID=1387555 RepID=A0ABY7BKF5_9FIRM|nr:type II toxin-antitoxin system RelE/ParE family toxin [Caldicellulosiruptor morganii]WAM33318.1 type II toxin-antitoxin system RelE/ParE family toxin [Caldicellulosiruptor morganii]